jgi:hypothetical protein
MKTKLLLGILLAGALLTAQAAPKDDVAAAAKKLANSNYSWKSTMQMVDMPNGGPLEGKASADGLAVMSLPIPNGGTMEIVKQGDKTVFKGEAGWQVADLAVAEPGPGAFMAMIAQSVPVPAAQTVNFRGPPGGESPTVSNAKASIKYWLADGALVKYELTSSAKISFSGEVRDMGFTTTIEIKDVGTTKVTVPEEARKLLK